MLCLLSRLVVGVALRKESVDRNFSIFRQERAFLTSLSARRAWIEIFRGWTLNINGPVALRKESVDRNSSIDNLTQGVFSRSPQGERG